MRPSPERILAELDKMAAEADEQEHGLRGGCACDQWTPGYTCDGHMAAISVNEAIRRINEEESSGNE